MTPFFGGWFFLLFAGMPVGFSLIVIAVAFLWIDGNGLAFAPQRMAAGLNSFPLLAVPFFVLTGHLMNSAGVTERLFTFARTLVGHITGSLGHVNVMASLLFSGMSGSAVADAGGLGQLEIKAMRDEKYDDDFAGAVTAASAIIGPLVPPSIPMVIYGVTANASVGRLFLAGVVPGVLCAAALMTLIYFIARKRGYPKYPMARLGEAWRALKRAALALLTPVIIIGGIFGGLFSPTEAAAVAALYALFLGTVVYRELSWRDLGAVLRDTVNTTAAVGIIVAGVSVFGWVIAREQVPQQATELFLSLSDDPIVLLLLVNLLLLVLGTFIESLALLLLVVPVLVPVALQFDIDPVHLGVVIVMNLMVGILTPPMGVALFVVAKVADIPFGVLAKAILPFLIPIVAVLLLITLVPDLVLFLPELVMGEAR